MLSEYTIHNKNKNHNDINLVALNVLGCLLGNNRKLQFCFNLCVNYRIVYFEHLNKPLRTICVLMDTCFDKSII